MTDHKAYFGKSHSIVEKDVYRVMKTDKIVKKSKLTKKEAGQKTLLHYNNNKYKTRS